MKETKKTKENIKKLEIYLSKKISKEITTKKQENGRVD